MKRWRHKNTPLQKNELEVSTNLHNEYCYRLSELCRAPMVEFCVADPEASSEGENVKGEVVRDAEKVWVVIGDVGTSDSERQEQRIKERNARDWHDLPNWVVMRILN